MRVKVNRLLTAGKYHVNFEVSDFTPDELAKMSSFGVPTIEMRLSSAGGSTVVRYALNQINKSHNSIFGQEAQAREYENSVLEQIRSAMNRLRESKDGFTSSEEVDV